MYHMRIILQVILIILSGCTTTALWESYTRFEWIRGFYVNKDRGELLVLTRNNGYVFPVDQEFGDTLLLSRRITFKPVFMGFAIDRKYNVTGTFSLTLCEQNSKQQDILKQNSWILNLENTIFCGWYEK